MKTADRKISLIKQQERLKNKYKNEIENLNKQQLSDLKFTTESKLKLFEDELEANIKKQTNNKNAKRNIILCLVGATFLTGCTVFYFSKHENPLAILSIFGTVCYLAESNAKLVRKIENNYFNKKITSSKNLLDVINSSNEKSK